MTPLDRLRELEPKATAGPWESCDHGGRIEIETATSTVADIDTSYDVTFDRSTCEANATLIAESRNALPSLLTLEALARDEHDQRCGCTGEACKLGEVLRVLDGGETEPAESSDEGNRVPEYMREDFNAMVAQMRDPEAGACSCGFPKKPCLRIMLRNGPPFPARPCEPV